MKRPITLHEGKLVWSGEHWLAAIRPAGADSPSAWVSLVHTRYSPAGEGNVAQVLIAGANTFSAICADNLELVDFVQTLFFSRSSIRDPKASIIKSRFQRGGDIRRDPSWIIEVANHRIVARWQLTEPPVIADGTISEGTEHFTILFFTNQASVEFDQQAIAGQPYAREIWKPSIGGERSSCFLALADEDVQDSGHGFDRFEDGVWLCGIGAVDEGCGQRGGGGGCGPLGACGLRQWNYAL
jgi:hypothetical protein